VAASDVATVFGSLPPEVARSEADAQSVAIDEQVRLFWDDTPLGLFFAAHPLHLKVAKRCRRVQFAGTVIPVLAPNDLAVFKVLFDRAKDWVDIATMQENGTVDLGVVVAEVRALLGNDPRVQRLLALAVIGSVGPDAPDAPRPAPLRSQP
jgi:hypothetical protein